MGYAVKLQNSSNKLGFKEVGVLYTYHLFAWSENAQSQIYNAESVYYVTKSTTYISVMTDGSWYNYFKALKPGMYVFLCASEGNGGIATNGARFLANVIKTSSDTYPSTIIDYQFSSHIFYFVL